MAAKTGEAIGCFLEWCDGELHDADGCEFPQGGWHCVTCHAGFDNNMETWRHEEDNPTHAIGWSCGGDHDPRVETVPQKEDGTL